VTFPIIVIKKKSRILLPGGQNDQICWKEVIVVDLNNIPNCHIEPLNPQPMTISQHFNFTVVNFAICSMPLL
jgi:hypothetical protein